MKKKTITFKDNRNGKSYEFKIKDGSCGPSVADLTSFYEKTGMFLYDPGFKSTASCSSEITFIVRPCLLGIRVASGEWPAGLGAWKAL